MLSRLCLLGTPLVVQDGQPRQLPFDRVLWLLALVALAGSPIRRETVANIIWEDGDSAQLAHRLRQLIYRAKNVGLADGFVVDGEYLSWSGECDVLEWRAALQNPTEATQIWTGQLLFGLEVPEGEFGAWLALERESMLEQQRQLLLRSPELAPLVALAGCERFLQQLPSDQAVLHKALGLASELHEPTRGIFLFEAYKKELTALDISVPQAVLVAVAQLGNQKLVPSQKLAPSRVVSLPRNHSQIIGRETELQKIRQWLDGDTPILSLVGIGGIGKTSLALKALRTVETVFVPLVGFVGQSLVSSVTSALGATLPGQGEAAAELLAWLERKPPSILLLDNVEQCLEATKDFIALIAATHWRVVLTSRQKLAVRFEDVLELEGLGLPRHAADLESASATAFLAAAKVTAPLNPVQAQALVRLCQRLAGTPLALELAAAWLRVMSLPEIEEEVSRNLDFLQGSLTGLPKQQNGLRAVFEHSWQLLRPSQQTALARLAVFRGGFSKTAALEITAVSHRDLLALCDASLLRREPRSSRWSLHELIRQYAEENLRTDQLEWQKMGTAHANYYSKLSLEEGWELEADNFRAVLTWSLSGNEGQQALALATSLRAFWLARGLVQEGIGWLQASLDLYPNMDRLTIQAQLVLAEFLQTRGNSQAAREYLHAARASAQKLLLTDLEAQCLIMLGRIEHRESQYQKAVTLYQTALDFTAQPQTKAAALRWLGRAEIYKGNLADATTHLETALVFFEQQKNREASAHCLNSLALIAVERRDVDVARACFQQSLRLYQALQDLHGQALNQTSLGWLEYLLGEIASAQTYTEESLALHQELGNRWDTINTQINLGHIAQKQQHTAVAWQYYRQGIVEAASIEAISILLEALLGVAQLWQLERPEAAAELLGLALGHPQSNTEISSFAQPIKIRLEQQLGAARFGIAQAKGLQRGLSATVAWLQQISLTDNTLVSVG